MTSVVGNIRHNITTANMLHHPLLLLPLDCGDGGAGSGSDGATDGAASEGDGPSGGTRQQPGGNLRRKLKY